MRRRSIPTIASFALFASLLLATPAAAAPALEVEIKHTPDTIYANDAFLGYEVNVGNTGPDPTSGALTVSIDLPQGLTLKRAEGAGWSCSLELLVCTNSTSVAPAGFYPTLDVVDVRIDQSAPQMPIARAIASGGGAAKAAFDEESFVFGPPVPFGLLITKAIAADEAGDDETQAGGHPYEASASFDTTTLRGYPTGLPLPVEDLHGGVAEIPAGVVGNPEAAAATCSFADLGAGQCPEAAAVGAVGVSISLGGGPVNPTNPDPVDGLVPGLDVVYRLRQEKGYPASFGFRVLGGLGPSFVVRAKVRSDGDYGITTLIPLVPQEPQVFGAIFGFCGFGVKIKGDKFDGCKKRNDPGANRKAFVSLGTDCSIGKPLTRFAVDSWTKQGAYGENGLPDLSDPNWSTLDFHSPELTGCETLTEEWVNEKEPSFTMRPDSQAADSPAAYTARLHIPQDGLEDPEGLATSHLKDTTVTLPQGLSFNPAIGDRLEACSLEQIGYLGNDFPAPNRIRFDTKLPDCPEASKVGTARIDTPILEDPLHGSIFLAAQKDNPFGSNYAIYLSIEEEDLGVVVKLPGKIDLAAGTGRISATFKDNPQLPFEDLELKFFGGDRSALANPVTCGSHAVTTEFTPWSAVDPDNPRPDEIARPTDAVQITSGANGAPCVSDPSQRPFDIGLSAGAADPIAGAKSPFSFRITRPDGSQELDRLEISPPPGFVASLKGIPYCSEAQIQAARSNSGKAEQATPSCPTASQVGTTNAGAGPGGTPFFAPGKLYLAGPHGGATLSVVAITPAVAGPFDLGNVVIRSALEIDPLTARITAVTDPLPQVFEGIPLRLRDVRIDLDRPGWAQNPTNCEAMSVDVTAFGSNGAVARPSNRFQVAGCERLDFKPRLSIHLKGGTKRGDHPALLAKLVTRPGDANIARAAVTLPSSAFLDQAHIRTICTRVQYAADQCPKGAVYGYATATTPLLDDAIEGDVILRSSDNKLPDLVGRLRGVANIEAVGRIDSVRGGIRNTFDVIPDAPLDAFTLRMQGGRKGLVVNSQNLCANTHRATVKFTAQNGRRYNYRPKVIADGCGKAKQGRRGKGKGPRKG